MQKIPTLFQRNYETDHLVRNEVTPEAKWVLEGLGVATRKFDGSGCLVREGKLYKRYEYKCPGKDRSGRWLLPKTLPAGYESASDFDPVTGKQQGWVPVGDGPEDRWHREAEVNFKLRWNIPDGFWKWIPDGTYELIGPKVQNNPEKFNSHVLVRHGKEVLGDCPRNFDGLREYLRTRDLEGVVWWQDPIDAACKKVKIKKRDFGLKRGT